MKAEANGRPLRVLLIAPSIEILGGQAVQATRLLASLRDEPSVEIEFQPIDPRLAGPFQFIKRIKFVRTAIRSVLYSLQLIWRVPRFDVIHTFSAGKSSYVLWTLPALVVGKLWRKLLIVNYRDGQAEEHLSWKGTSTTLQMADAIVSPSDYVVKVFADRGIPAKRIFNIIDPTPFVFRQRSRLKPVFLTNRILEPLYNVECVLRAFALVQQRYPEASLTVAHDGPSRRGLERLARELCLRNTRFVGQVPHDRTPQLYNAAEIYLTSPNVDCMPGSLMECFCSGLPVIATAVGGIPFIVEHERTGLLVNRNDHEAMAACAIRLLEDPALVERLTFNARAEVERYNAAGIRHQWVALYHEIAADEWRLSRPPASSRRIQRSSTNRYQRIRGARPD
jgi:glycosyltransferase involved in cell wall biosynthesis